MGTYQIANSLFQPIQIAGSTGLSADVRMGRVVANRTGPLAPIHWTTHRDTFPNAAERTLNGRQVPHGQGLSTTGTFASQRDGLFHTTAAKNVVARRRHDRIEGNLATDWTG